MKGIVLSGGKATGLYPITKAVSKLLGTGKEIGISFKYAEQSEPRGLADAFLIGEEFIGDDDVCLILGDNLFYGEYIGGLLKEASEQKSGATIFGYYVKDPERYGVVEFDNNSKAISLEEKPEKPKSNWAITGLYFYDNRVVDIAKNIKPSPRGEIEITDINRVYKDLGDLHVMKLGRGYAWLDTGTYNSLVEASMFIRTLEERQGLKVGSIEEIAYRKVYIKKEQLAKIATDYNTSYGDYLLKIINFEEN